MAWFYTVTISRSHFMRSFYEEVASEVAATVSQGSVLDIGTGPGHLPIEIARLVPGIKLVGLDVSGDMIRAAGRLAEKEGLSSRVSFVTRDAASLPFEDASFDLVLSTASLHHWKNPSRILNEACRVLKEGKEAWIYDIRTDVPRLLRRRLKGCGYGYVMSYLISLGMSTHSRLSLAELKAILQSSTGRFSRYEFDETWSSGPFLKMTLWKKNAFPSL